MHKVWEYHLPVSRHSLVGRFELSNNADLSGVTEGLCYWRAECNDQITETRQR